jgi:hypothetical protein
MHNQSVFRRRKYSADGPSRPAAPARFRFGPQQLNGSFQFNAARKIIHTNCAQVQDD